MMLLLNPKEMVLLSIPEFIGRFHPVLVHLPIGVLLLGCFFQLLTISKRFTVLRPTLPLIYLLGGLAAVFSSITGYLLSQSGDYDGGLVDLHQWLGISVAVISMAVYLMCRKQVKEIWLDFTAVLLIILVSLTGHYGGSLTHGSDYLTAALTAGENGKTAVPEIQNVQQALAYTHMIQPLLKNRCYSCHGADKQKGKLRLDAREWILKGGEEGQAIVPGSAEESELMRRLLLPVSNEDHMPPREKPQLTAEEIELLSWWIREGADFTKKVADLRQSEKIKPVLLSFQSGTVETSKGLDDIPAEEVAKADVSQIAKLKQAGVVLIPVTAGSNYLSASFVTAKASPEVLKLLTGIKKQLVWLNMANTQLDDKGLKILEDFSTLVRINLSNTAVTDQSMQFLKNLEHLQHVNLVGTKVSAAGVGQLKSLRELKNLYLYRSLVTEKDQSRLKHEFPKVNIDFGGYIVPLLPKDTMEAK